MVKPSPPYRVVERGPEADGNSVLMVVYRHPAYTSGGAEPADIVEFAIEGVSPDRKKRQMEIMDRIARLANTAFENGWNCREYGKQLDKLFESFGHAHVC